MAAVLERLKRKFMVIVMTLVGTVLASVLGLMYYSSFTTQANLVKESLNRGLEGNLSPLPVIGSEGARVGGMLTVVVEVSEKGVVLQTSESPAYISSPVLARVVDDALTKDVTSERIGDLHVVWKSALTEEGNTRIAIVDTTIADRALTSLLLNAIVVMAASLSILFAVASFLSNWAISPIARAWEQQRRFVADASHELKTPLSVILANSQILARDDRIPEDDARWVESTVNEAQRMKNLVNDLLELAKAEEGTDRLGSALSSEEVDFSNLVESAALEFDPVAFERGCSIETSIEPGLKVKGDPEWLERLAKILIDNACKYARPQSVVRVRLRRSSRHVQLSVNNQGAPIAREDLPHIFDRFYRSERARSRTNGDEGGFGLGLAIAKGVAEACGGGIAAESDEASGTTFTVTF